MSAERVTLQHIREDIDALRPDNRHGVEAFARHFRRSLVNGGSLAAIALALVAAEEAARALAEEEH